MSLLPHVTIITSYIIGVPSIVTHTGPQVKLQEQEEELAHLRAAGGTPARSLSPDLELQNLMEGLRFLQQNNTDLAEQLEATRQEMVREREDMMVDVAAKVRMY